MTRATLGLVLVLAAGAANGGISTKGDWRPLDCSGAYANFGEEAQRIGKLWFNFHAQEQSIARGESKAGLLRRPSQWFRYHNFAVDLSRELRRRGVNVKLVPFSNVIEFLPQGNNPINALARQMHQRKPPASLVVDVKEAVEAHGHAFWQPSLLRLSLSPSESLHGILGSMAHHELEHMETTYRQLEGRSLPLDGATRIWGQRAAQRPRIGYSHYSSLDEPSAYLSEIQRDMTYGSEIQRLVLTNGRRFTSMNGGRIVFQERKADWPVMGSNVMVQRIGLGLDLARKNVFAAARALADLRSSAEGLRIEATTVELTKGHSIEVCDLLLTDGIYLRLEIAEGFKGRELAELAKKKLEDLLALSLSYEQVYDGALKVISKKRTEMNMAMHMRRGGSVELETIDKVPAFNALVNFQRDTAPPLKLRPEELLQNDVYERSFNGDFNSSSTVTLSLDW